MALNQETKDYLRSAIRSPAGAAEAIANLELLEVTAGTVTASKAVVVGATKNVDLLDITTLMMAGTTITPTAAKINSLLQGTAANYKLAAGTVSMGAQSVDVNTGLAGVTYAVAQLVEAPTVNHCFVRALQINATTAGYIRLLAAGLTSATTSNDPLDSPSGFLDVNWIAFGS
jgi:hypothetical protein